MLKSTFSGLQCWSIFVCLAVDGS